LLPPAIDGAEGNVMPVVLLLLGIVTTVAGLLLAAPGLTIRDGTFDTEIITPGIIAVVGGLLLIGMGLVVRVLQRIERELAARPLPRAARAGEAPAAGVATEAPDAAVRIPFPPKPKSNPQPVSAGINPAVATTEDTALERLRVKFPNIGRPEGTAGGGGADASLTQPTRATEEIGDLKNTVAVGRGANGASPARVAPRFDIKVRAAAPPDNRGKGSVFKPIAVARGDAGVAAQSAAPALPGTIVPAPVNETVHEPAASAEAPSILKSGVVEGMAYSLYSDGSIEAQLPQGTLRFGSISALRHHIESTS
jgi:hypothetical protein